MSLRRGRLVKTLWGGGKMQVTSIFPFSHVFYAIKERNPDFSCVQSDVCKLFQFDRVKNFVVWLRVKCPYTFFSLTLYHTIPTFNNPEKENLLKTLWEKKKMPVTSIFSFSCSVFYRSQQKFLFLSDIYFVVCKCFQFRPD